MIAKRQTSSPKRYAGRLPQTREELIRSLPLAPGAAAATLKRLERIFGISFDAMIARRHRAEAKNR